MDPALGSSSTTRWIGCRRIVSIAFDQNRADMLLEDYSPSSWLISAANR
jgi:hypothetical protein